MKGCEGMVRENRGGEFVSEKKNGAVVVEVTICF
jgi:hypothetical protein